MENFKINFQVVGVIVVICLAIWAILSTNNPKISGIENSLKKEYSCIQQLPYSTLINLESSHKSDRALVDAQFKTDKNFDEIKKFYDGQLSKLDWVNENEQSIKDWNRDLGGYIIHYTKGEYSLDIQYAGNMANYGWTYSIAISWGYN